MRLERAFSVSAPVGIARERALAYMRPAGYAPVSSEANLTFKRTVPGVNASEGRDITVTVQIILADFNTSVAVTYDVATGERPVTAREKAAYTSELNGLEASMRGEEPSVASNAAKRRRALVRNALSVLVMVVVIWLFALVGFVLAFSFSQSGLAIIVGMVLGAAVGVFVAMLVANWLRIRPS